MIDRKTREILLINSIHYPNIGVHWKHSSENYLSPCSSSITPEKARKPSVF